MDRPEPLPVEVLEALEVAASAGQCCNVWPLHLAELVRVYRQAIAQDASDDVGPFDFFFR
jgi:hypothetical protein